MAVDEPGSPMTTPTKSGGSRRAAVSASASASKAIPTPVKRTTSAIHISAPARTTPSRSSARSGSSKVDSLVRPSLSGTRSAQIEIDMDDTTMSSREATTPSRRSARVAAASEEGDNDEVTVVSSSARSQPRASDTKTRSGRVSTTTTPTKSSSRKTTSAAFEAAMNAPSPTKVTPSKPKAKVIATPTSKKSKLDPFNEPQEQVEVIDVPYEPYLDDMLARWRDGAAVEKMKLQAENWRVRMLGRLTAVV